MNESRKALLLLGDAIILAGSFFITLNLGYWHSLTPQIIESHKTPFVILYLFWLLVIYLFNLYEYSSIKPTIGNIRNIATALIVCAAGGALFFYLIPFFGISPKINLLINIGIFGILFIGWRRLFFSIFSKNFRKAITIIGENEKSRELADEISRNPHMGYRFVGFVEDLGDAKINHGGAIVLAKNVPLSSGALNSFLREDMEILTLVEAYEKIFAKIPLEFINEDWFVINIKNADKRLYYGIKRFMDLAIAVIVGAVAIPFGLLIALGIKLEDGRGVFYKQKRIGLYNRPFRLYKFQTYVAGAEKNGAEWSQENDPRITRFGRFLRKTHMDELPQLINVFRGELSLVGPRPERPEFVETLEKEIPYFDLRHIIKPGVTGWAQVKFKYAGSIMESYQKFEFDMFYAKNQNFYMDLGIIFRTIQKIFV